MDTQFEKAVHKVLNAVQSGSPRHRSEAYFSFDEIYEYLDTHEWAEDDLVEAPSVEAFGPFQKTAQAYYSLGFYEKIFFQNARQLYELWYQKTVDFQESSGNRIHKGMALHQIGYIYEIFGLFGDSWKYYSAAFIEDIIDKREFDQHQGYRALRRLDLPKGRLKTIAKEVRELREEETLDPLQIFYDLSKKFLIPSYKEITSIDFTNLNKAKALWRKLRSEEES